MLKSITWVLFNSKDKIEKERHRKRGSGERETVRSSRR